jgi:hypothetical protein
MANTLITPAEPGDRAGRHRPGYRPATGDHRTMPTRPSLMSTRVGCPCGSTRHAAHRRRPRRRPT